MICPNAGVCGGCSLLHLSYPEQEASKEAAVKSLLAEALSGPSSARLAPLILPVYEAGESPSHFRQKVSFVFAPGPSGQGLMMGHYQHGSHRVVPVSECPAHNARGNRIAFALRDHLVRAGVSAAGPSLAGILRHIIVRTTADEREAVAMLVVTRNEKSLRTPIRALLASDSKPDGFFININDEPGPFMVGDRTIKIDGRSHVREAIGPVSYLISPAAFFQTNSRAAAVLQQHVVDSAKGAERVLDLYCGSGLFALPLAASGLGGHPNPAIDGHLKTGHHTS